MKNNKFVLSVAILVMLSSFVACAGYKMPRFFKGESFTYGGDNVLRNDILREIYRFEQAVNNCNEIFMVGAKITSTKEIAPNRMYVEEYWTIVACERGRGYKITLKEDENKEVDFTVSYDE